MKKRILLILALIALFVTSMLAVSCSGEEKIVLNVYNWGEYISDGSEDSVDVNAEFEKYCKTVLKKNVEVNYTTFESNESMYNKLKIGAVSYDIVVPSDYMISRMVAENMLEELNFENIPNFQYISERYRNPYYDPEQKYSVPYFVGYVGIIYNTKYVDEADIGGWDLLWNKKYEGKILQFNNARDALGTAMFKEGISVNTHDSALWNKALDELKAQKPLLQAYVMDEVFNKMQNGSAWIAPYYVGDFLTMYEENEDLGFYFPSGGTNIFADAMCIPKGAPNKEMAEAYINFMLTREIGIANAEWVYYSSPNELVNKDPEYIADMTEIHPDAAELLDPQFETGYLTEYYHNFDDETLMLVNSLWEQLKIESSASSNIGVYITCAVIVAGLAVLFTVRFVIRRKRAKYY